MNAKYVNPFLKAVEHVLGQFGIVDITKKSLQTKEDMSIESDVTAFVGVVGDIRGNVAYAFSEETAKKLASAMMMGMPVEALNDMTRSALAELSNMFTGNAAAIFESEKCHLDITPPSLVVGEEVLFVLSFFQTLTVSIDTAIGTIDIHIGLEV